MLNFSKQYRADYTGEKIVTDRKYERHQWTDLLETVTNSITNNQISNRAVVIGNGISRLDFDLNNLKHFSGLLGANTLQTYGCNSLYKDFAPDFLVAIGDLITDEVATTGPYINDHIVYTRAQTLLKHPGKFYLIPHDPYADAGTTAAYIAAFDGHKTIFLLGFDGQENPGNNNVYAGTNGYDAAHVDILHTKWIDNRVQLFSVYDDVDWVWVTPAGRSALPEQFASCSNLRQISFREFVLEADL